MRTALTLVILAALGGALVASGCGGDDDDTTTAATTGPTGATGATGGEPLSKEQFISEADAICQQGDKEINQEGADTFGNDEQPSQEEQQEFVTDTVLPNIQNQVDGIRALTPPEGDEDQVSAILDAAQKAIDEAEQDPSVLTEGGGADPFAEANELAKDYGLTACGGG